MGTGHVIETGCLLNESDSLTETSKQVLLRQELYEATVSMIEGT